MTIESNMPTEEVHSQEVILKVENLKKYFPIKRGVFRHRVGDVKAVDGVSFNVYKGETLGLVGDVAVIFIWAGWITLSRYGMKTPLTPSDLTMLRYATALCFVSPLLLWYDWKKHSLSQWLVVGLGVGFPYTLLSFYGLKTIGAGGGGVILGRAHVTIC